MMNLWRPLTMAGLIGWVPLAAVAQPARNVTPPLLPKKVVTILPTKSVIVSVDKLLNFPDPLSLAKEVFEVVFVPEADGHTCIRTGQTNTGKSLISAKSGVNLPKGYKAGTVLPKEAVVVGYDLTWSDRKLPVSSILAVFDLEERCQFIALRLPLTVNGQPLSEVVLKELTEQIGAEPIDGMGYVDGGNQVPVKRWLSENHSVDVAVTSSDISISVNAIVRTAAGSAPVPNRPALAAALDALTNFNEVWKWSPEELEKHYTSKEKDEQKAQFEWLNAAKDRARFSRRMFANVNTTVTMFGGSVKVEEAILEFVNGRAARATVSFYNRGDSGDISVTEFERIYKKVGQSLTESLRLPPRSQLNSSNAALKTTGWNWTTPAGIALLEYNDYSVRGAGGKPSQPEFLRLKLAAPDQADWSMGKLAVGVQRMALTKNITKTADGDVYIAGVPMVDQGAKGYCVAASCQRLFEYMRIPCDQHEMAKLISVDAERGASIMVMQKSLAKVDGQFQVAFKPLINPLNYYDNRGSRRVSIKEFAGIVKEHVDKGVPLLWGLELGRVDEIPPLPNAGQVSGGHMRMVIGYNSVKNQILFTDSWGAGHELKRMPATGAYEVTLGLYSMAPRGM